MSPLVIKTTGFSDYMAGMGGSYIKCLVFGPADAGKTRSASFWPRPFYADCENGRMSIADRAVPYAEIRTPEDMDAVLTMLKIECAKPAPSRRYLTFVVDTIDSFQRKIIQQRLTQERKAALSGWQDWGFLDAKMTTFLERAMSLPMNVVVLCHVKNVTEGDGDDKVLTKEAKLKGDIREQIVNEFDLIGHLEPYYVAEGGKRVRKRHIRWHADPNYPLLKDRSGHLPQYTDIDFTEGDYERVYNAIVGDFLDDLPETAVVDELDVAEVTQPAPPTVKGGPVDPGKLPAKRTGPTPQKKASQAAAAKRRATAAETKQAEKDAETAAATEAAEAGGTVTIDPPVAPETGTPPEATPEPADLDETQPSTSVEDTAAAEVAAGLGGTVISDTATDTPAPADVASHEDEDGDRCGDQPSSMVGKFDPVAGVGADGRTFPCRKPLADEPRDRVNVAVLRTRTLLCSECFEAWKRPAS